MVGPLARLMEGLLVRLLEGPLASFKACEGPFFPTFRWLSYKKFLLPNLYTDSLQFFNRISRQAYTEGSFARPVEESLCRAVCTVHMESSLVRSEEVPYG